MSESLSACDVSCGDDEVVVPEGFLIVMHEVIWLHWRVAKENERS